MISAGRCVKPQCWVHGMCSACRNVQGAPGRSRVWQDWAGQGTAPSHRASELSSGKGPR